MPITTPLAFYLRSEKIVKVRTSALLKLCGLESSDRSSERNGESFDDQLIQFYRSRFPSDINGNAAHVYLTWDDHYFDKLNYSCLTLGALYSKEVANTVKTRFVDPNVNKLSLVLQQFIEDDGHQRLLSKLFPEKEHIIVPLFNENLFRDYTSLRPIDFDKVAYRTGLDLVKFGKEGRFDMTERKKRIIESAKSTLSQVDLEILRLRGFVNGDRAVPLREIADTLNVTSGRIQQRLERSFRKLRDPTRRLHLLTGYNPDQAIDDYIEKGLLK